MSQAMSQLTFLDATAADLPFIIGLLESDPVVAARDPAHPDDAEQQVEAFAAIAADPNHRLIVAMAGDVPVGSFQLSFIPGVSRQGAWRGQIESARIAPEFQGSGYGSAMMEWAVAQCRAQGCGLVQLTSDVTREDAHRFYDRLGFRATHTGFKLKLR